MYKNIVCTKAMEDNMVLLGGVYQIDLSRERFSTDLVRHLINPTTLMVMMMMMMTRRRRRMMMITIHVPMITVRKVCV